MAEILVLPATEGHARQLAATMRLADRNEVEGWDGRDPLSALFFGLHVSEYARAGFINGEIAAMWGLIRRSALSSGSLPWLLTSSVIERYPLAFVRAARNELAEMRARGGTLSTWLDARHCKAARWILRCGFLIGPPEPVGRDGLLFHPITLEASGV